MKPLFARATFGLALSVGLLGLPMRGPSWLEYTFEYALIGSALALAWACWGRVLLAQLPRSTHAFALIVPILLTLGAVIKAPQAFYPFFGWGMFGRSPAGDLVQYRVFMTDDAGTHRIMPGADVSDVVASSLDGHLRRAIERAPAAADTGALERLLAGIRALHEATSGHRTTVLSGLERCTTRASSPTRLRCETVEPL